MEVPSDDAVLIQKGKKPGEPHVITVNCPDKHGLGCDICRIILDFGLYITKGDVSTDGIWCYMVFWVVPHSSSPFARWPSLKNRLQSLCPSCSVTFYLNDQASDSAASPVYLLKFFCLDRKGLLHDVTQVLCELELTIQKIAYGRFSSNSNGYHDLDLSIQQKDGKKIVDPDKQNGLCSRLKVEMLHSLRVIISNRGPDTELLVANPVELSGKGRPRVFYDVTLALKALGICIFSAEIGRHSSSHREWEVYRFLLDDNCRPKLSSMVARNQIVDRVRRMLMGW